MPGHKCQVPVSGYLFADIVTHKPWVFFTAKWNVPLHGHHSWQQEPVNLTCVLGTADAEVMAAVLLCLYGRL